MMPGDTRACQFKPQDSRSTPPFSAVASHTNESPSKILRVMVTFYTLAFIISTVRETVNKPIYSILHPSSASVHQYSSFLCSWLNSVLSKELPMSHAYIPTVQHSLCRVSSTDWFIYDRQTSTDWNIWDQRNCNPINNNLMLTASVIISA